MGCSEGREESGLARSRVRVLLPLHRAALQEPRQTSSFFLFRRKNLTFGGPYQPRKENNCAHDLNGIDSDVGEELKMQRLGTSERVNGRREKLSDFVERHKALFSTFPGKKW
jgi:hypothetical protein